MKESGIFRYISLNYKKLSHLVKFLIANKNGYCHIYLTASLQILTIYYAYSMWKIYGKRVNENICIFGRGKDN